jgi:hypothetical protein
MTKYELKTIKAIQTLIGCLIEEKGYTPYDISVLIDDFIYENDFSNECNQVLWKIQDKYINMYRGRI